jgi:hypothetical protein
LARHEQGFDFWAGRVSVRDWSERTVDAARAWTLRYTAEPAPIHGASLGVSAGTYLDAGDSNHCAPERTALSIER